VSPNTSQELSANHTVNLSISPHDPASIFPISILPMKLAHTVNVSGLYWKIKVANLCQCVGHPVILFMLVENGKKLTDKR
jgi:hypothetical protein